MSPTSPIAAVRQRKPQTLPRSPELIALDQIRLDKDWSFPDLARAMASRGFRVSPRTLHYLLKGTRQGNRPLDRTLYKIRLFCEHIGEMTRRNRAIQRSKRANTIAAAARGL